MNILKLFDVAIDSYIPYRTLGDTKGSETKLPPTPLPPPHPPVCPIMTIHYVKNVSRHQHDNNRKSRIATVDSCFALLGARQHCVAKICKASPRANARELQNDPLINYIKFRTLNLLAPRTTRCHITCFGAQEVTNGVSKSKKLTWLDKAQTFKHSTA